MLNGDGFSMLLDASRSSAVRQEYSFGSPLPRLTIARINGSALAFLVLCIQLVPPWSLYVSCWVLLQRLLFTSSCSMVTITMDITMVTNTCITMVTMATITIGTMMVMTLGVATQMLIMTRLSSLMIMMQMSPL